VKRASRPTRRHETQLRFRKDGTFTIAQLTDVHWRNGDAVDLRSRALVESVLDAERPDLVVLTGDVVEGSEAPDPAEAYRQAVDPFERRGIPWASVFGNHDDEGRRSRRELLAAIRRCRFSLAERGPSRLTGVGNYVVRVARSRGRALAAVFYFLDSNSYDGLGVGTYAWIGHDQIAWYRQQSRRLRKEYRGRAETLPALAFFHIPLPEYAQAWDRVECRGHRNEPVCCPELNSGFFAALVEEGDVMGTFVGHDHVNDFEGELHGIRLCYGRATGFSPYGLEGFLRGVRLIRLREGERKFETWLRLEDGTRVADPPVHAPQTP
jgi:3',5'-cyclic AMP phosphodiesterase CpdA